MGKAVYVCDWGVNLPCEKANTNPSISVVVAARCRDLQDRRRELQNRSSLPLAPARQDTIYRFFCLGSGEVVVDKEIVDLDRRGFISLYWKKLNLQRQKKH